MKRGVAFPSQASEVAQKPPKTGLKSIPGMLTRFVSKSHDGSVASLRSTESWATATIKCAEAEYATLGMPSEPQLEDPFWVCLTAHIPFVWSNQSAFFYILSRTSTTCSASTGKERAWMSKHSKPSRLQGVEMGGCKCRCRVYLHPLNLGSL